MDSSKRKQKKREKNQTFQLTSSWKARVYPHCVFVGIFPHFFQALFLQYEAQLWQGVASQ